MDIKTIIMAYELVSMTNSQKLRDTLDKRNEILRSLINHSQTKSELTENVTVSRSTINRAISDLQELRCVEFQDGRYHPTIIGRISLKTYDDYVNITNNISEVSGTINSLPEDSFINSDFIKGASTYVADPQVPETALMENSDLLRSATKLTGSPPLFLTSYLNLLVNEIQENNLEAEIVVERNVLDSLHKVRGESFKKFISHDNIEIFSTKRSLPCAVWVIETPEKEYAAITAYDRGSVQGVIMNESDAAIQWARETHEKYRESTSKLEEL